jgi:hypothetical protein
MRRMVHTLAVHRMIHCLVLHGLSWRVSGSHRLLRCVVVVVRHMIHRLGLVAPLLMSSVTLLGSLVCAVIFRLMSRHNIVARMMMFSVGIVRRTSLQIGIRSTGVHNHYPFGLDRNPDQTYRLSKPLCVCNSTIFPYDSTRDRLHVCALRRQSGFARQ